MKNFTNALKDKFNFEAPKGYQILEENHALLWKNDYRAFELNDSDIPYFWLNEMEWYQPSEISQFEFEDYHKSGFVPFAHTGGRDYWCWSPEHLANGNVPVLICPHDCEDAEFYAPDFSSALFRHALEYAASSEPDEEKRLEMTLNRLLSYFSTSWKTDWVKKIQKVSSTHLSWQEYEDYIKLEFGKSFINKTIVWMN